MAGTGNVLIGFPNVADVDFWTPKFLPAIGNWQPGAPLLNLQNDKLSYKARSVGCTADATRFCIDLTTSQSIVLVAIPRHNLTLDATMKVTLFADGDAALSSPLDGGQQMIEVATTFAYGSLPFGHPSYFTGVITAEEARFYPQPAFVIFPQAVIARYVLVEFVDTQNPAGYVELNRLMVCPGYQPSLNIINGAQFGVTDPSLTTYTMSSRKAVDKRPKYRTLIATISYLPQDEAFASVYGMMMRLGVSGQCFVSALPNDQANRSRVSFLATITKLDPLTAASYGLAGVSFAFEEAVS